MPVVDITETFEKYSKDIWTAEINSPRWFRNSSLCWMKTYDEFLQFVKKDCGEIIGYFENETLKCVAYFEHRIGDKVNVHFSVLERFDKEKAIESFCEHRNDLFRRGIKIIDGFIVSKNFGLRKLVKRIGFCETELEMRFGVSHGRVLEWKLFRITRI